MQQCRLGEGIKYQQMPSETDNHPDTNSKDINDKETELTNRFDKVLSHHGGRR